MASPQKMLSKSAFNSMHLAISIKDRFFLSAILLNFNSVGGSKSIGRVGGKCGLCQNLCFSHYYTDLKWFLNLMSIFHTKMIRFIHSFQFILNSSYSGLLGYLISYIFIHLPIISSITTDWSSAPSAPSAPSAEQFLSC